jgi:hypothetical protein
MEQGPAGPTRPHRGLPPPHMAPSRVRETPERAFFAVTCPCFWRSPPGESPNWGSPKTTTWIPQTRAPRVGRTDDAQAREPSIAASRGGKRAVQSPRGPTPMLSMNADTRARQPSANSSSSDVAAGTRQGNKPNCPAQIYSEISRAHFAFFHSLIGIIFPSGVSTSDPVVTIISPLKVTFCVRTAPLNNGEAPWSILYVSVAFGSSMV